MAITESQYSEEYSINMANSKEKHLNKILSEQSNQMLSLVNIANAHSKENDDLKMTNKNLLTEINKLQNEKNDMQYLFDIQTLLFILLILILIWMYNSKNA